MSADCQCHIDIGILDFSERLLKSAVITNILSRHTSHFIAAIFGPSDGPVDVECPIYMYTVFIT